MVGWLVVLLLSYSGKPLWEELFCGDAWNALNPQHFITHPILAVMESPTFFTRGVS